MICSSVNLFFIGLLLLRVTDSTSFWRHFRGEGQRIQMTDEEALLLWPKVKTFVKVHDKEPNINAFDPLERRLAEAIVYIKAQRRAQGV